MSVPIVSIIIPAYNAEPYLQRCLAGVDAQRADITGMQVVIVDDGSTDGTASIAADYASSHPDTVVISQPNRGQSAARNAAIDIATGKWIAFLDSDDAWEPSSLIKLIENGETTDANIVQGTTSIINTDGTREEISGAGVISAEKALSLLLRDKSVRSYVHSHLFRRELFEHRRFTEGMDFEDYALMHELIGASSRYSFEPSPHYLYYRRPDSLTGSMGLNHKDLVVAMRRRYEYIRDNYPSLHTVAARKLWQVAYMCMVVSRGQDIPGCEIFEEMYNDLFRDYGHDFKRRLRFFPLFQLSRLGTRPYGLIARFAPNLL